jgi:hypothetical protein
MKRSVITTACALGLALSQVPSSTLAQQPITISNFSITSVKFGVSHAQVVISGRIVCLPPVYDWSSNPNFGYLGMQQVIFFVTGHVGGFSRHMIIEGSGGTNPAYCNGEFQDWSLTATTSSVAFNDGPATVTATAAATDQSFNYGLVTSVTSATPILHP